MLVRTSCVLVKFDIDLHLNYVIGMLTLHETRLDRTFDL